MAANDERAHIILKEVFRKGMQQYQPNRVIFH